MPLEHRSKRALARIAMIECDRDNFLAARETLERQKEPRMPAPAPERHASLALERAGARWNALERAGTRWNARCSVRSAMPNRCAQCATSCGASGASMIASQRLRSHVSAGHGKYSGKLLAGGVHAGDLLMLCASAALRPLGVLLKRWRVGLPSWQSTYFQAIAALLFMLVPMLRLPLAEALPTRASLPLIAYAGALASVVLPFFWMQGVKHLGPNRCNMYMNLLPVFTAALAVGAFGERLYLHHLVGGGVALAAVLLAQTWRAPLASLFSPQTETNDGAK